MGNTEVFYRAINFYLRQHPLHLRQLPLIQQYLMHVQRDNIAVVNEAVNELLIQEENFNQLRESIADYDAFDQIALAQQLQKHEPLEFRRIAAHLYRSAANKRYTTSITLSKQDGLWQDAMETAALSCDNALAEELLRFFVENIKKESCPKSCFAACLFTCFELIRPDVVLELSWRYGLIEYCMPFMVQTFRTFNDKLDTLYSKIESQEKKIEDDEKKQTEAKNEAMNATAKQLMGGGRLMLTGPGVAQPQMNQNPYMPQQQQFGGGGGGQMFGGAPQQPQQQQFGGGGAGGAYFG